MKITKKRAQIVFALLILLGCFCMFHDISIDVPSEKYIGYAVNAPIPLKLESAYGDLEATHPKVLAFDQPWNGWKYWMTFTPYPRADDSKENPHIKVSNDGIEWKNPGRGVNPLYNTPEKYERGVCYNSDSHLVYNSDTDQLECWWRYVDDSINQVIVYRMCSSDGVVWQSKESVLERNRKKEDYLSPAILYEDGLYKMWYIGKEYVFYYIESADLVTWSDPRVLQVPGTSDPLGIWHIDVIHDNGIYEVVFCGFDRKTDSKRRNMNLYYCASEDNSMYSSPQLIMSPTFGTDNWDNRGLYRPCILFNDGEYWLYYSGIKNSERRGVGVSKAQTMEQFWTE